MPQERQYEALALDLSLTNTNISPHRFEAFLEACEVWKYPWGAIFAYGNEMHMHVLTTWRKKVFFRKELKEVASAMFDKYDLLQTSTLKNKPLALNFNQRIGWRLVNEDDDRWYFEMKKEDFKIC